MPMIPPCTKPFCWVRSARYGSLISLAPASTAASDAPIRAIAFWRAKLSRTCCIRFASIAKPYVYVNVNLAYTLAPMRVEEKERTEFSISELSREFEITPRAIRFYEDQGLISPPREGQRRGDTARDPTRPPPTPRGKRLRAAPSQSPPLGHQ